MSKRIEKCSECDNVYVRDSETGKVHPRYRAEQICDECHSAFQRGFMQEHISQFWSLDYCSLRPLPYPR